MGLSDDGRGDPTFSVPVRRGIGHPYREERPLASARVQSRRAGSPSSGTRSTGGTASSV